MAAPGKADSHLPSPKVHHSVDSQHCPRPPEHPRPQGAGPQANWVTNGPRAGPAPPSSVGRPLMLFCPEEAAATLSFGFPGKISKSSVSEQISLRTPNPPAMEKSGKQLEGGPWCQRKFNRTELSQQGLREAGLGEAWCQYNLSKN